MLVTNMGEFTASNVLLSREMTGFSIFFPAKSGSSINGKFVIPELYCIVISGK